MRRSISTSFWLILIVVLLTTEAYGYVLKDPGIPDGEQIIWRVTEAGEARGPSIITWRTGDIDGKPVYEITMDGGERKQARYIIRRADMRLIEAQVSRNTEEGRSTVSITLEDDCQYLVCTEESEKTKKKKIDCSLDGYDGTVLPFSLRGFPFETQKDVKLKITPPFRPGIPFWAWRMWKSKVQFLGTEVVTVPAGTFDCYKLRLEASGGLIKRLTSAYYFWFTKEPPYQFVKYQDEDGKAVTELMEIRSNSKEK